MNNIKRYSFVDYNGNFKGIEDVDDLQEAVQLAVDYQCEVIDRKTPSGNQIVYSVWDGWNSDWDYYDEEMQKTIMKKII